MSDKDKRKDWLKQLKVGSVVVLDRMVERCLAEVTKITPTGIIYAGGQSFSADGISRENRLRIAFSTCLSPATDDVVVAIKKEEQTQKYINILCHFGEECSSVDLISFEDLRKVADILTPYYIINTNKKRGK